MSLYQLPTLKKLNKYPKQILNLREEQNIQTVQKCKPRVRSRACLLELANLVLYDKLSFLKWFEVKVNVCDLKP